MALMKPGHGSFEGFGFNSNTSSDNQDALLENLPEDQKLAKNIQLVSHNVVQLEKLSKAIGSSTDSSDLRKQVRNLLRDTSVRVKQTGEDVQTYCNNRPEDKTKVGEWKFMKDRLKDEFKEAVCEYQRVQDETRKRERTSLRQTLIQSGYHDLEISQSGEITRHGKQCQLEDLKEEEQQLDLIKQREEDLKQLEKDIVDVNEIFHTLAGMVKEQGEQIDEVEKNVIIVEDNIQDAVKDLSQAEDNMDKNRRMKIGAVVIFVVVLAVIIAIILAVTL